MAANSRRGLFSARSKWVLSGALVVLGSWFGWGAYSQWQAEKALETLEKSRDVAVQQVHDQLEQVRSQLSRALLDERILHDIAVADEELLKKDFAALITGLLHVQVQPFHLAMAYADPGTFGWSRLALLEQSIAQGNAVARVVRDQGAPHLGVAAPLDANGQSLVVYLRLPVERITEPFSRLDLPDNAYLGLRQGRYTVLEIGDSAFSSGADVRARPVADSDMRIVAAIEAAPVGPLGMGALMSAIVCLLLLLMAGLVSVAGTRVSLSTLAAANRRKQPQDDGSATFAETLQSAPAADVSAVSTSLAVVEGEVAMASSDAPLANATPNGVDAAMFSAYDIRGVVGAGLSADSAQLIGRAIGSELLDRGLRQIVVARDGRLSGEELSHALIDGLRSTGCDVTDIGLAPSPVAYFAAYHLQIGSCVVVTGSHNPPQYNGFKIVLGGETLHGEDISALRERIVNGKLHTASDQGSLRHCDVQADYIDRIAGDVQLERPIKVVVDAGNGVAGQVAPQLLESIGAKVIPLFCDVDGNFPNHHPDPSEPVNLEDLVATVRQFDADIGLAFDGDGDRLGVVTPSGKMIYADRLLMLFAADVLMRNPGAQIIYDVKCTGRLFEFILFNGGSPLMWKTGHSLIKAKMRETEAELAGEMSGHFFFKERWYGFDDGLYAAARLLEILAQREESVEEVFAAIPEALATPEIKIQVEEGGQHALVALFAAAAQSPDSPLAEGRLITVDGLRADFVDGWGLIRASNTTPSLVLRFEGEDEAALERIRTMFRNQLDALSPGLGCRL